MKKQVSFVAIAFTVLIIAREFVWMIRKKMLENERLKTQNFSALYISNNIVYNGMPTITWLNNQESNNSKQTPNEIITFASALPEYKFTHPSVHNYTDLPIVQLPHQLDLFKYQLLSSNLILLNKKPNVWVIKTHHNVSFLTRIEIFCKAISDKRQQILAERGLKSWDDVQQPDKLLVLWGRDDDFLGKLVSEKKLRIVLLPWRKSKLNNANVVVGNYYEWTASRRLCEWIRTPGYTKAHWDAVYKRSCTETVEASRNVKVLEPMYFYAKPINKLHYWPEDGLQYPTHFYTKYPIVPLYLTIIQDGIINLVGDVISGGIKIVPYTCSHDNIPTIPNEYMESPIYKEIFVVTQFWGDAFFHRMVEVLPRLSPYLLFLKENPSIKIHAPNDRDMLNEMMKLMGLNPERIVVGVVRAKVIYLPQGTPCGFPHVQSFQLLAHHFRTYMNNRESLNNSTVVRNKLVLIRRSGTRRFLREPEMEAALRGFSEKHRLHFHLFSDNPSPGLVETMSVFGSALVVVAPHGAGLSNVIFSWPGTLVVEGVCNPPHVNMCFQFVAHVLGHRYHGIPSLSGCESYISIDPQDFVEALGEYFNAGIVAAPKLQK